MFPVGWLENNLNVVAHIPVRVPSYSPCQLDIPGLEGHLPDMDSQQVGILHHANHECLCSLVQGIYGLFLLMEGARGLLSFLELLLHQLGCLNIPPMQPFILPPRNFFNQPVKIYSTMYPTHSTKATQIYLFKYTLSPFDTFDILQYSTVYHIPQERSPWNDVCHMHIVMNLPQSLGAWPPPPPPQGLWTMDAGLQYVPWGGGWSSPSLLK